MATPQEKAAAHLAAIDGLMRRYSTPLTNGSFVAINAARRSLRQFAEVGALGWAFDAARNSAIPLSEYEAATALIYGESGRAHGYTGKFGTTTVAFVDPKQELLDKLRITQKGNQS